MPQNTLFTGQPIFNQLLSLIPAPLIAKAVQKHGSDRYVKKFKTYDHLVSMLFGSFHKCTSLRELITGLQAHSHRLKHLGIKSTPRRSTLADANERRTVAVFEMIFHELCRYHLGPFPDSRNASKRKARLDDRIHIIDSTTVTTFSNVLPGLGPATINGKRKGGLKAHVMMRLKDNAPTFVLLTSAKESDRKLMPLLNLPSNAIVVMDRGYVNYEVMKKWSANQITWVTRMNDQSHWELQRYQPVTALNSQQGILEDAIITLGNPRQKHYVSQQARLITFYDEQEDRKFRFLTNNMIFSPITIARLYKKRWGIELLFKRIKQNFQLHDFLGDNANAILIQMWCALIADLLITVIKNKLATIGKNWSIKNLAGLIRLHLGTYIHIIRFLQHPEKALLKYHQHPALHQLTLFKT